MNTESSRRKGRSVLAKGVLGLLLLALSTAGCISSRRMIRAMPFGQTEEESSGNRVNAWPLFYQSGDRTSVLWPVTDFDSDGFAIRPLIAKDRNEWSLLWPLAGWDTPEYTGWFATAYRGRDNWGVAPLFNIGKSFTYLGPVWWDDYPKRYGLFPLYGKLGEKGRHVGPVWWNGDAADLRYGVFPCLWVAPDSFHLFPLYMQDTGRGSEVYLPGYGVLGGLVRAAPDDYAAWLTPFWLQLRHGADFDQVAFPFYWYENRPDYRMFVTPLGGRGWDSSGKTRMVNVLGPVYHHNENADGTERFTSVLWPVFWRKTTPELDLTMVLPLAAYWRLANDRHVVTPLVSWRWNEEGTSLVNVLGPLYNWSREGDRSSTYALFCLVHTASSPERSSWWIFPLASGNRKGGVGDAAERAEVNLLLGALAHFEKTGEDNRTSVLGYLWRRERKGEVIRRDFFPFVSWDSEPEGSRFSFLWRVVAYHRRGESSGGYVFFVPWGEPEGSSKSDAAPPGGGDLFAPELGTDEK
jgi:hypothetical protein